MEARNGGCTCLAATVHRKHCYPHLSVDWPRKSWAHSFPRSITGTRFAVFVTVVMCLGACIALHPVSPGEIAFSIRRCLFGHPSL